MDLLQVRAELLQGKGWKIVRIHKDESKKLPSRGMVMAEVIINGIDTVVPLEPDGEGGHWFRVFDDLIKETGLVIGGVVLLSLNIPRDWTEPDLPEDVSDSLDLFDVKEKWDKISVKARWEWIRWIRDTKNLQTREKRVETACSMLAAGKKRPCCFNYARCTETYVSKNGILELDD
jgi:hypothetical protein